MRVSELFYWIKERNAIYLRKTRGMAKPWTKDEILQRYRFCNVYRERDTVTQWIAKNWRTPFAKDPNLFFAMCLARLVNWPDTLAEMGYPKTWHPDEFISIMRERQEAGVKAWGGAYIVSTNGRKMLKEEYIAHYVLTPLWDARKNVQRFTTKPGLLEDVHDALSAFQGMGSFMAAQVVADLKYIAPLNKAPDWHTFAASGPGSRRGLNRVLSRDKDAPWREQDWKTALMELKVQIDKQVNKYNLPPIHAQDLQNCLCEFDKYERVRLGEGEPRSTYPGAA